MRDRYNRFTVVMDVLTIVAVVGAGLGFWKSLNDLSYFQAGGHKAISGYEIQMLGGLAAEAFNRAVLALITGFIALASNLAIRTLSWIWIGRFWR
jgi:hypothetical protein